MGVIEKYKDSILYYQIEGFNLKKNINLNYESKETSTVEKETELMLNQKMNHVFSTRIGWNQENIFKSLSEVMEIPEERIYRAKQVHGTDILVIDKQNYKDVMKEEKDGLITNIKGIALATYHADCVPIYFYDNKKEIIGLAHAGWKGTLNNISESIINGMVKDFKSNIEDISVAIGPSIGKCCYEIGHDVEKLFMDKFSGEKDIIEKRDKRLYLNLVEVNRINLMELGIKEENIFYSNFCTSCNINSLYSYRKENGTKNRMVAAISLN